MKHKIQFLITLLLLIILLAPQPVVKAQGTPQPTDPQSIFLTRYEAINAGDLAGSLVFIADTAIGIAMPPPAETNGVFLGHEAYRGLNSYLIDNNAVFEFIDIQVAGDIITFRALLTEDLFRMAGVFPIRFSGTAAIQDGLVISETWIMDKESQSRLEAAITLENNKAILRRAYEQIFSEGKLELLDEDIAPDAIDHGFPELRGVEAFKGPMAAAYEPPSRIYKPSRNLSLPRAIW